jgi:5-methylcytosine-specific restriction endonuclease McrA
MTAEVVVVNATYEPLERIPATRAIVLLGLGQAESLEDYVPEFPIRSQHEMILLPKVIRMLNYVVVKHHVIIDENSKATPIGVLRRDKSKCGYCGEFAATVDHIIPKSRGGKDTWINLIAACSPCNEGKADRTPEEAGMLLLWPPRIPKYDDKLQRYIWKLVEKRHGDLTA